MEKNVDRLTAALRAVAEDDAAAAPGASERLTTAFRLQHPEHPAPAAPGTQHPAPSTRHLAPGTRHLAPGTWHLAPGTLLGFGIAATLAAAVTGAMWLVTRGAPRETSREITTAFMPLTYSALPYTDAQIVRLEVPRSALRNFGLAPAELVADAVAKDTVLADVLVGEDGLARAVRFVRAERAPGVAP